MTERELFEAALELPQADRDGYLDSACGTVNGEAFEWIADADMRLGPVLEAVVNGKYYWMPFSALAQVDIDPPEDLRDMVWLPAHFLFVNGGAGGADRAGGGADAWPGDRVPGGCDGRRRD